jgi:DNA-binding response OmpR family regulator
MSSECAQTQMILVVEDVRETRDGIDKLLQADGYRVALAEDERDAIDKVSRNDPDLILVSLAGSTDEVVLSARRIRERTVGGEQIPVVVFSSETLAEGEEVAIDRSVYVTRPDNFNQLRGLLARLLNENSSSIELENTNHQYGIETIMTITNGTPFEFRFVDTKQRVLLELTNKTEMTLKSIEILTVFLKDEETPGGGPSQAHIRFDRVKSVQPKEKAVLSHRTWINGKPATEEQDQLGRLEIIAGAVKPYVLDISWEDVEGKTQFQRIPIGH